VNKKILVVAAHCDDEILGCGGTMGKHVADADEVICLILNNMNMWQGDMRPQAQAAAKIIGHKLVFANSFEDNQFDKVPLLNIVQKVEELTSRICPNIVYTHYEYDLNIDHRLTFQAVLTAFRPGNTTDILSFEVPSSTEWASQDRPFAPNYFVDIGGHLKDKIAAIDCYKTETAYRHDGFEYGIPHPRSPRALATRAQYWAIVTRMIAAEPFKVIRMLR